MKQYFLQLFSRVLQTRSAMVLAPIVGALAVVIVFAALTAAPVAAQGPSTSCFEALEPGAVPQAIEFASSTYTSTIPAGQDVCIESGIDLLLGFVSTNPFAVNGDGASAVPTPGTGFLYGQGPVSGILTYDLTASEEVDLVLTDVNGAGGSVLVWLGSLKSAPAVSAAPTPVASATKLVVVGPGPLKKGAQPKWDISPLVGDMSLKISAGVVFTATTNNAIWPAQMCGADCFEVVVPTNANDGTIEATALTGWWWTATLVGDADSRVLMPAPASASGPTTGKVQYKNAAGQFFATANCTGTPVSQDMAATIRTCGGARGRIVGAPTASTRPHMWLPLLTSR